MKNFNQHKRFPFSLIQMFIIENREWRGEMEVTTDCTPKVGCLGQTPGSGVAGHTSRLRTLRALRQVRRSASGKVPCQVAAH
ncbi:hypothetical protein PCA20602_02602 [Pandoraea capi]|uniref:Uncharacterized protein n=1 Tax=Pandoraea capi TaxID=2508286 RepID=A0ABY6W0E2_9BURK|nr:hypothetical protein PCA20602_02602 [Pandoraea capi]